MFDLSKIGVRKNVPKVGFTDYSGIIVGFPKFGKTTIASLFPNAIIVPFEVGFKAQVVNVADTVKSWEDFIGFVDMLEKHRAEIGDDVKTLVFDTVNEAYDMCLPYMLKKEGQKAQTKYNAIGDLPYGQGYGKLDQYFKEQIDRIIALGFCILFISHSKVKTIKPKNGEPYDVYTSTMSDRLEKIVYPLVDYIIFGEQRKVVDELTKIPVVKRVMVVSNANGEGNADTNAGGRVALKANIPFDTEQEAVEKFQTHFRQAIEEKLRKAGITEDINVIEQRQKKEKDEEVKKYIESRQEPSKEDLVNDIKTLSGKATQDKMMAMMQYMTNNKIADFSNPDSIDVAHLKEIVSLLS